MSEDLKIWAIRKQLGTDPLAADFQWSLLTAAAVSYRHDSVLRPFPPMFMKLPVTAIVDNGTVDESGSLENRNYDDLVCISTCCS
jgi:ARTD15 N-terminal domain